MHVMLNKMWRTCSCRLHFLWCDFFSGDTFNVCVGPDTCWTG